jgi:hypothetical protein
MDGILLGIRHQDRLPGFSIPERQTTRVDSQVLPEDDPQYPSTGDEALAVPREAKAICPENLVLREMVLESTQALRGRVQVYAPDVYTILR